MEEIQVTKNQIRSEIANAVGALSEEERAEKTKAIEKRLFEFANFLESKVVMLYVNNNNEVTPKIFYLEVTPIARSSFCPHTAPIHLKWR